MTTLKKDSGISVIPGSPGTVGDPGVAPSPAYCVTVVKVTGRTPDKFVPINTPKVPTGAGNGFIINGDVWYINDRPYRRIPGTPITTTSYVCYPGTPGTPPLVGTPATPTQTLTDFNLGWNAGAVSRKTAPGDCTLSFKVPGSTIGAVVGLSANNIGAGYEEIRFGLYCSNGIAAVYELGVRMGGAVNITSSDLLSITRTGSTITYARNGATFYTSLVSSTGPLFADSSLYSGGDSITDADLTVVVVNPATIVNVGSVAASLQPLQGTSSTGQYTSSTASFLPLAGANSLDFQCAGSFLPLQSTSSASLYASSTASFLPLKASNGGGLQPSYSVSSGSLAPLRASSLSLTGGVGSTAASLRPLQGTSSTLPYAYSAGSFEPLQGYSAELVFPDGYLIATLTDGYRVEASGTEQELNVLTARLSPPTVSAFGGAAARAVMPRFRVTAVGTNVALGRVRAKMPMGIVTASGTVGAVGQIVAVMPGRFSIRAFGGAVVSARLQDGFVVKASGLVGAVGSIRARMPLFVLTASVSEVNVGRIQAAMPMLRPVNSGVLRALMPMGRLSAAGTAVVAMQYEAYAVNLLSPVDQNPSNNYEPSGTEVTHYTNFPFNQIVRFEDKYYGVSDTGLFLLGGDTDIGAPIPWALRTATTDFGSTQKKTVVSAYVGGTVDTSAVARVIAGEHENESYSYPVPASATGQNWRVKFGRGLKTRYFSLELSDDEGGQMQADSIDFEINNLTRGL